MTITEQTITGTPDVATIKRVTAELMTAGGPLIRLLREAAVLRETLNNADLGPDDFPSDAYDDLVCNQRAVSDLVGMLAGEQGAGAMRLLDDTLERDYGFERTEATPPATSETVTVEAFHYPAGMAAEVTMFCDRAEVAIDTLQPMLNEWWRLNRRIEQVGESGVLGDRLDVEPFMALAEASGLPASRLNDLYCRMQNMVDHVERTNAEEVAKHLGAVE